MSRSTSSFTLRNGPHGSEGAGAFVGPDSLPRWLASREGRPGRRNLDVVLITHPRDGHDVPRLFPWAGHLSLDQRRALCKNLKPVFGEVIEMPELTAGILFLPIFAAEIMDPATRRQCRQVLEEEALPAVASAGGRAVVCLGGLTGSLSAYGRKIEARAGELGLTITTGHSVTAVSVLRTYLRAANDLARDPACSVLSVVGLGSVGGAFIELLARQDQQPRVLVLVDRPARREHIERLAEGLRRRTRMSVVVELTTSAGPIEPDSLCYRSTFLVTAVSTPNLIDVGRVAPGTVLIDDSQPYCWSRAEAWDRCRTRRDIAPCEAGLVDCAGIGFRSHFPFDFADHGPLGSHTSWSCLAEGLLRGLERDLPPTLGEPNFATLLEYDAAFLRRGFKTPPLQCGAHELPVDELQERFARC
jgi:predicted amino acid dehydrogenase